MMSSCSQNHDKALQGVFQKFLNVGLNNSKCEFNKHSLKYFRFVFSDKAISPDPKKVQAIHSASPPTSTSGVSSFLGIATYCAKFILKFSDFSQPLHKLTRKDFLFRWKEKHETSFKIIKQLLTSDIVVAYFDQTKKTALVTDASPWGLSAIVT